jgi:hypothetical protein
MFLCHIGAGRPALRGANRGAPQTEAVVAVRRRVHAARHARAVVFPLRAGRQWRRGQRRPSWTVPAVMSWAGTRGVVPLAAALSIPLTAANGTPLPQRDLLLVLAVTVIVTSLTFQGRPWNRWSGAPP